MIPRDLPQALESLAVLADPVRRRLYEVVSDSADPLSRDRAARSAGVSRALAAFHLEKLVDAGLLESSFKRLSGRTGPGAGRPSKLYVRSALRVDVSLPERRYEWAAHMLARALADVHSDESVAALQRSARAHGESVGREQAEQDSRVREQSASDERRDLSVTGMAQAKRALESCGFEPAEGTGGELLLRNCLFDRLRDGCRELVCGMNLSLVEGVISGLAVEGVTASLEPSPGRCCVVLRATGER
jgi:predicted ArsR family transcriptional regulator